jgi:hypothetical protein
MSSSMKHWLFWFSRIDFLEENFYKGVLIKTCYSIESSQEFEDFLSRKLDNRCEEKKFFSSGKPNNRCKETDVLHL